MSLIPNTFNGLVSAIKALAEDDSQEFENYIPTAIFLAEERLIRELDSVDLITTVSVTASASAPLLAKPSGLRFAHDIRYRTSSGSFIRPQMKQNDFIRDYWPIQTSVGQPKYYGNENGSNWVLAPTPASAYEFTVQYVKQETHLSAGAQTNYYTNLVPDALYYATMSQQSEFMKDYSTQQIWEKKYQFAVQAHNNEARRERRDDGTTPLNPEGGGNTLTGDN